MEIKDPLRNSLHLLIRNVEKDHSKSGDHNRTSKPGQDIICERREFFHDYSRTTCPNISHPVTTKMTSNASRTRSHTDDHGSPLQRELVTFTVAISRGMSNGSNITGNNTSRARVRTAIADNSVPNAEKPTIPSSSTTGSMTSAGDRAAPNSMSVIGVTI